MYIELKIPSARYILSNVFSWEHFYAILNILILSGEIKSNFISRYSGYAESIRFHIPSLISVIGLFLLLLWFYIFTYLIYILFEIDNFYVCT